MKILKFMDDVSSYHRTMDLVTTKENFDDLYKWLDESYGDDVGIINLNRYPTYIINHSKRDFKYKFIVLFAKEEHMTFFWLHCSTKLLHQNGNL